MQPIGVSITVRAYSQLVNKFHSNNKSMKKLLVEFIGSFFLVFTVGMCVIAPGAGMLAPMAIGAVLMVMVYAGGHISGGHFNPAVTLGVWLRGKMTVQEGVSYMVVQVLGALAAAAMVGYMKGNPSVVPMSISTTPAFIAEMIGAFALVWVVLNVATARATAGNSYYGLAIGFTVTTMALSLGGISGGAFNPAVAIGMGAMNLTVWGSLWVYIVANLVGGALAAGVFRLVNSQDR